MIITLFYICLQSVPRLTSSKSSKTSSSRTRSRSPRNRRSHSKPSPHPPSLLPLKPTERSRSPRRRSPSPTRQSLALRQSSPARQPPEANASDMDSSSSKGAAGTIPTQSLLTLSSSFKDGLSELKMISACSQPSHVKAILQGLWYELTTQLN